LARILLIDDDVDFSPLLAEALGAHGHDVRWLDQPEAGLDLLSGRPADFDLVLLDQFMPRMRGLEFVEELRRRRVNLPVLLFTCRGTADVAIGAARLGVFRYLPKPDGLDEGLPDLLRIVGEAAGLPQAEPPEPEAAGADGLLGNSPAMHAVYERVGLAATQDGPVLLTGETGVGKAEAARAVHRHSGRRGPLLRVNCLAYDAERLEDELFGCEAAGRPGVFEQADGGAVLLAHFHALGRAAQARQGRLIEEGVTQRNGPGAPPRAVHVRLFACSGPDLPAAAAAGRLDPALYFLLNRTVIAVPPLRARGEDMQLLADHFLRRSAAAVGRPARTFRAGARERLRRHPWPGNVREVQGVVGQAVLSCRGAEVGPDDLLLGPPVALPRPGAEDPAAGRPDVSASARSLPPSRERAYRLYLWAVEQDPQLAGRGDAEVFRRLRRDPRVEGEGLPDSCDTFRRYLREARAFYDDSRHTARSGRPHGRSVVAFDRLWYTVRLMVSACAGGRGSRRARGAARQKPRPPEPLARSGRRHSSSWALPRAPGPHSGLTLPASHLRHSASSSLTRSGSFAARSLASPTSRARL